MSTIDITNSDTLTLSEACALLPRGRNGSKPHLSTVLRWILSGAPALDGRRIRLAAVRVGAKWVTSRQALQEFALALTPAPSDATPSPPRTSRQRARASERAAEELERIAGI